MVFGTSKMVVQVDDVGGDNWLFGSPEHVCSVAYLLPRSTTSLAEVLQIVRVVCKYMYFLVMSVRLLILMTGLHT